MSQRHYFHPLPLAWARLAAFFGLLAVLSALLAPVSMLAEEVRTGKLGGLCSLSLSPGSAGSADQGGSGAVPQERAHCDLCASPGWTMPPLPATMAPAFGSYRVARLDIPAPAAAAIPGLPFSRGPPSI